MAQGAALRDDNRQIATIVQNLLGTSPIYLTGVNLTNANALHVAMVDGTGTQITAFGGIAQADNSTFTASTTQGTPAFGFYHSTIDTVTDGRAAALAIDSKRNLFVVLRDAAGNARGLNIDASGNISVTGNIASGATDSGNPLKVGGKYNSTPITLTDGQRGDLQLSSRGSALITPFSLNNGSTIDFLVDNADGVSPTSNQTQQPVISRDTIFNGTNYDRLRSIINATNSTGMGIVAAGMLAQFDDVSPTAITENQFGNLRMSANRNAYTTIRDAAGNERGANVDANNNLNVVLAAETTKVIGTTRNVGNVGGVFDAATAASVPTNALYEGVQAITALPTAVSNAQLVGAAADKYGRQIALLGTIRDLVGTQTTTISASTSETTIVTAAASVFNDLMMLIISNTSTSTNTRIDFRDTTGGSVLFSLQSNGGQPPIGFSLGGASIPQTTVNTNWTAQAATSTTDLRIYAVFAKNK